MASKALAGAALLDRPKAFRWTYQLVEEAPQQLVLALPLGRLVCVAAFALLMGSVLLLHPEWFEGESPTLLRVAGWGGVFAGACLLVSTLTQRGRLVIDAGTRQVRLEFRTLGERTDWMRPFDAFSAVRTRQVKDGHGLHNHWEIEIVADDGTCLRVGYGLLGTVRRRSRDALAGLIAGRLGIPVEHQTP